MVQIFLILFIVALAVVLLTKNTFTKDREVEKYCKQVKGTEEAGHSQGHFHRLAILLKIAYYAYIKAVPNYEGIQRIMDTYGKSFRLKLPFKSFEYLITSDPVLAKRIMADPTWSDRHPAGFYIQDAGFNKPYGLLFGTGKSWKVASKITGKLLQQLGFFNAVHLEGRFVFEMQELETEFAAKMAANGGEHTFSPADTFSYLSINVVFHILLGKRNPFEEAVVRRLISGVKLVNRKVTAGWTILEVMPFLRRFPRLTFLKSLNDISGMIYDILREAIAEKRRSGRYKEHVEDLVDGMLQHVDKIGNDQEDGLNEESMLVVLRDLLFAGADTTSTVLEYGLLYMALHPPIQEKVQAEIHQVLGPDRAPAYNDRRRMPYTEAVLNEIYRMASPVPAVGRIKKEAKTFAPISLYGIHRNELFFEDPYGFQPERFLDRKDPLKVVNTENLMPFGYGRRSCPGETAARVAVFVYFVVMMQKYWIKLSENHPPPSMKNTHGLSRSPLPYHITIKKIRHL